MKKTKLKDICNISTGGTPSRSNINYWNNGDIPWCKIGDFSGKYINQVKENITEEGLKNSSAKIFKRGTILYTIFATVGEVAILEIESATNQAIAGLELINNEVDLEYLYYYLKSLKFVMLKKSRGVAQNNINLGILKNIEIKIPDKMEQINIAKILANIEKVIDKKNKQLKELNTIIKSQFVEMFGIPFLNDKNWKHGIIKDLVREVKYGTSKPANGGKYKYLRMNNITYDGKLDLREIKYIDIEESDKEKYLTKNGDILFNRTNSKELVGKTCVFDIEEEMIIAGFIIRVRINEFANPYFISEYMNTVYLKEKLRNMCKDASGQSNINAKELENIKIYIPPITLQNQFSEIVKQIDKQKFEIEKSLKETQELYESLMEKYFG